MTNQDILHTVKQEAQDMDRDTLLRAYLKASEEVLGLSGEREELKEYVEKLEAIVSGQPEALQHYLGSHCENVRPIH
jgi:ATP-dependent Lon protease